MLMKKVGAHVATLLEVVVENIARADTMRYFDLNDVYTSVNCGFHATRVGPSIVVRRVIVAGVSKNVVFGFVVD